MNEFRPIVAASPPPPDHHARIGLARGQTRMAGKRLRAMASSMLGQMVLATILFIGFGIYTFAVAPLLSMPSLGQPDPATMTMAAVRGPLMTVLADPDLDRGKVEATLRNPLIRDIRRHNPAFTFYMRRGDKVFGNHAPRHWQVSGIDRLDAVRRTIPEAGLCTQFEKNLTDSRGNGYVFYSHCTVLQYLEIGGIRTPVALPIPTPFQTYRQRLWSYSRNFLVPSLGIFVLMAAILLVNVLRIRRVARLTRALSAEVPDRLLPEKGLPSEVVPLVQSMNVLIARADDAQRQRRFFLSAAAHEIRTPLTILRTRMEGLPDDDVKAKLIRDLSRLTELSDGLLTLMNVEARDRPFARLELDACCLAVIGELEALAVRKDVTFTFHQPSQPTIVNGDASLLEVAITNLVDNALSFAPAGSSVVIALNGAGGIDVRDFGRGIQNVDAETLFQPFVRMGAQRPGHGLGLAIVRAIADLHGGTVSAADAPGGGACFSLRLPTATPA